MVRQSKFTFDPAAHHELEVHEAVYYEDADVSLPTTIYKPKGEGPFPGLVRVHGGAWNVGKREAAAPIDRQLAQCGMVVAAIDFRLAPAHPYPAQVQDTNLAVRWFKLHAAEYGVDPSAVGGAGDSSGGHTMLLNAMRPDDPLYAAHPLDGGANVDASVDYVIALWPVLDPYSRYFYARGIDWTEKINQHHGYFLNTEAMRQANPQMILERGEQVRTPPILIIQGDTDDNIPRFIPLMFEDVYRAAGAPVRLEWFPGMPHGFAIHDGDESRRAIDIMKRYIAERVSAD